MSSGEMFYSFVGLRYGEELGLRYSSLLSWIARDGCEASPCIWKWRCRVVARICIVNLFLRIVKLLARICIVNLFLWIVRLVSRFCIANLFPCMSDLCIGYHVIFDLAYYFPQSN